MIVESSKTSGLKLEFVETCNRYDVAPLEAFQESVDVVGRFVEPSAGAARAGAAGGGIITVKGELLLSVVDESDASLTRTSAWVVWTTGTLHGYVLAEACVLATTVAQLVPASVEHSILTLFMLAQAHLILAELPAMIFSPPFGDTTETLGGGDSVNIPDWLATEPFDASVTRTSACAVGLFGTVHE